MNLKNGRNISILFFSCELIYVSKLLKHECMKFCSLHSRVHFSMHVTAWHVSSCIVMIHDHFHDHHDHQTSSNIFKQHHQATSIKHQSSVSIKCNSISFSNRIRKINVLETSFHYIATIVVPNFVHVYLDTKNQLLITLLKSWINIGFCSTHTSILVYLNSMIRLWVIVNSWIDVSR